MLSPVETKKNYFTKENHGGSMCHAISLAEVLDMDVADHNNKPINISDVIQN